MTYGTFGIGCCCCPVIGIDAAANNWRFVTQCCENSIVIENLKDDITLIDHCAAVCCGASNDCQGKVAFTSDQYSAINQWIQDGGRLYVQGEYIGCYSQQLIDDLNYFMSGIGSSLVLGTSVTCPSCNHPQGIVNTDLAVMDDVEHIYHAATNNVSGGTWLAKTNGTDSPGSGQANQICIADVVYIAIEQIGDGFVVLGGDSNLSYATVDGTGAGCYPGNCPFFLNYFGNGKDRIL